MPHTDSKLLSSGSLQALVVVGGGRRRGGGGDGEGYRVTALVMTKVRFKPPVKFDFFLLLFVFFFPPMMQRGQGLAYMWPSMPPPMPL